MGSARVKAPAIQYLFPRWCFHLRLRLTPPFSFAVRVTLIRLNLEIQLTIKISEKTEQRRFGVILAPFSS